MASRNSNDLGPPKSIQGEVQIVQLSPQKEEHTHVENITDKSANLVYDDGDEAPKVHLRTWVALAAMWLLNYVQVLAVQGPPAVLSFISKDLQGSKSATWVLNSLSLVQAVLGPVMSSGSDTFQARKTLLLGSCMVSFVGSAIAPGSSSINRLIAAQTLIGVGFASAPLGYCVPSEILPRKWRPMAQACINIAAALGAISGPLIVGALIQRNAHTGWRYFFWLQMGLWGATALGILVGYHPPKRHTALDHLSFWQKIGRLDLPGIGLLTIGLVLFLTGMNLGGNMYAWSAAPTMSTIIIGIVFLIAFAAYEWKGTKTGLLNHELFRGGASRGRTFGICVGLIFTEGVLVFAYTVFNPQMSQALFESDAFLIVARNQPFWVVAIFATLVWGYISTKYKTIRWPLVFGNGIFTAAMIAYATIQPGDDINQLCFSGLAGIGFGAPLILIVTGVQLATPHSLIATATAVTTTSRAVSATLFTAIYSAVLTARLSSTLGSYIAEAVTKAGLPAQSVPQVVAAISANNYTTLADFPPAIIDAGTLARQQSYADSLRTIFIITAVLGVIGTSTCVFVGDMSHTMNYRVDAPVEHLHAKHRHEPGTGE